MQEAYGKQPLYFEANRGQTDQQVRFLSRGNRYTLFLTSTEAVLTLAKIEERKEEPGDLRSAIRAPQSTVLRM